MCSRCRTELSSPSCSSLLGGCNGKPHAAAVPPRPARASRRVISSALAPGLDHSLVTVDPRAAAYYDNAEAVITGKRLFGQYNCSGCHSNGGGGMGPSLMDDEWIYGGRLEQIHQTLVEGGPTACLPGAARCPMSSCGNCRLRALDVAAADARRADRQHALANARAGARGRSMRTPAGRRRPARPTTTRPRPRGRLRRMLAALTLLCRDRERRRRGERGR